MSKANENIRTVIEASYDKANIQLCLAASLSGDVPSFQRVNITNDVAGEFRQVLSAVMKRYTKAHADGDLVLKKYDPQTKPDRHEIEYLALDQHKEIKNQLDALASLTQLEVFSESSDFMSGLRFYAVVVTDGEKTPVIFFRSYSPKKELGRSKSFGIVMRNGQYDRFTDKLFLFDSYFDCIAANGYMFILNKDKFQRIFRFYEMLIKTAKKTLDTIEKHIPIDDFDAFRAACEGHLQKVAKLKNIATKPYLTKLTMNDLKKVIEEYKLPIEITGEGEDEQLKFDSSDKWSLLRLLDDDYLKSIMTGEKYETNSKRTME